MTHFLLKNVAFPVIPCAVKEKMVDCFYLISTALEAVRRGAFLDPI